MAILDHGALVADGTPDELTAAIAGRTFAVQAAQPRRAQQALLSVHGVLSVAQIGNSLRVLAQEAGDASTRLRDVLAEAGLQADVTATEPSLEDVFVAATHGDDPSGDGKRERAA